MNRRITALTTTALLCLAVALLAGDSVAAEKNEGSTRALKPVFKQAIITTKPIPSKIKNAGLTAAVR
ncbi:MAG: hypothetical protein ACLP0B_25325 [Steroidobacteraceae bacterium]|jgi:hypothetical protein